MHLHKCNDPVCIISKLPHQVRRAYDWCSFTEHLPKGFIANCIRNAHCGKLNVESQQFRKLFWGIRVPPGLTTLVKFLRFEMDNSGKRCPHSVMVLTEYYDCHWWSRGHDDWHWWSRGESWVFCGRRFPWQEKSSSNELRINVTQRNVIRRLNLTITYQLFIEQELYNTTLTTVRHMNNPVPFVLTGLVLHYEKEVRQFQWMITVKFGYNILFSRSTHLQMSALLSVFDGPLGGIQMFSLTLKHHERTPKQWQHINKYSSYIQVSANLDIYHLKYLNTTDPRFILFIKMLEIESNRRISLNVRFSVRMPSQYCINEIP